MPADPESCETILQRLDSRLERARVRFQELAQSRTGNEKMQGQLMQVLEQWLVSGREETRTLLPPEAPSKAAAEAWPFKKVQPLPEERCRTCVPLSNLRAAAGWWSEEQARLEIDEETEWIAFKTGIRFEPGMFVAKVEGDSIVPQVFTLSEIKERYGISTPRRQFLFERFQSVFNLLHETGKVKNIYLFGSFQTETSSPNDLDLVRQ